MNRQEAMETLQSLSDKDFLLAAAVLEVLKNTEGAEDGTASDCHGEVPNS